MIANRTILALFLLIESVGSATQSASFVVIAWLARALMRSLLAFSKTSLTGP